MRTVFGFLLVVLTAPAIVVSCGGAEDGPGAVGVVVSHDPEDATSAAYLFHDLARQVRVAGCAPALLGEPQFVEVYRSAIPNVEFNIVEQGAVSLENYGVLVEVNDFVVNEIEGPNYRLEGAGGYNLVESVYMQLSGAVVVREAGSGTPLWIGSVRLEPEFPVEVERMAFGTRVLFGGPLDFVDALERQGFFAALTEIGVCADG